MEQNIFYPSFLFATVDEPIKEGIHFKSITILKGSSNPNLLNVLHFELLNNKILCSRQNIASYLKEHIISQFYNNNISSNIEEHLVRHNSEYLIFSHNKEDNSICIKYLSHKIKPQEVSTIYKPISTSIRENATFDCVSTGKDLITGEDKSKKRISFPNLLNIFGKKDKKTSIIEKESSKM